MMLYKLKANSAKYGYKANLMVIFIMLGMTRVIKIKEIKNL